MSKTLITARTTRNLATVAAYLGEVGTVKNVQIRDTHVRTNEATGVITAIAVNAWDDLVVTVVSGSHTCEILLGTGEVSVEVAPAPAQVRR